MNIPNYPSIYTVGHKAIRDIFAEDVVIEEKVDGSQFSFGVIDGKLEARSKGCPLDLDNPSNLFAPAVDTIKRLESKLRPNWIYRAEALCKPKHNAIAYERAPKGGLVVFDIEQDKLQNFLLPHEKFAHVSELGLETVPMFFHGKVESFEQLKGLLNTDSFLGGTKVEGFVAKNYYRFGIDKKILLGKYVSEGFKELNHGANAKQNRADLITEIVMIYKNENRWLKAVQHLREAGKLEGTPKDIGTILREVNEDILKEEGEAVKERIFNHFWKQISRGVTAGLPEWYKDQLAQQAFAEAA